jgi:F-type H+-transporting ATPase subunit epsilon
MELVVLTPEEQYFKGNIKSITVPGVSGEFEVLENHAPLVSAIGEGRVKVVKTDGEFVIFDVNRGFLEVINNDLALLVNEIKPVD